MYKDGLKISSAHLQKFYNEKLEGGRADKTKNSETGLLEVRKGGLAPKTIKHIHFIIQATLEQAVKEKLISVNVAKTVKLPKIAKKEMKTLDMEQIRKFLQVASSNHLYKRYFTAYLLELYTGLRRGELLGIRWKDINFNKAEIRGVQQLVKVGSSHILRELKQTLPKTGQSLYRLK